LERFFARLAELDNPDAARAEIPDRRRCEMEEASRQAEAALR
jgi:hypothetical protein